VLAKVHPQLLLSPLCPLSPLSDSICACWRDTRTTPHTHTHTHTHPTCNLYAETHPETIFMVFAQRGCAKQAAEVFVRMTCTVCNSLPARLDARCSPLCPGVQAELSIIMLSQTSRITEGDSAIVHDAIRAQLVPLLPSARFLLLYTAITFLQLRNQYHLPVLILQLCKTSAKPNIPLDALGRPTMLLFRIGLLD
jgi:hypothetical protein